ncbi:unnamed protein product [Rangifer tarandus platyrhynchus]|uniref:Uncharacterized protein n=1 Tax=Rangifer tarandus platyrhynchus TaxID=3082113 RepID=A0ACB1KHL6_RANTA
MMVRDVAGNLRTHPLKARVGRADTSPNAGTLHEIRPQEASVEKDGRGRADHVDKEPRCSWTESVKMEKAQPLRTLPRPEHALFLPTHQGRGVQFARTLWFPEALSFPASACPKQEDFWLAAETRGRKEATPDTETNLSPKGVGSRLPKGARMLRVLAPHVEGGLLAAITSSCKGVSLSGRSPVASLLITSVQPARACPSLCVRKVVKISGKKKKKSTQMHQTQPCNHQT